MQHWSIPEIWIGETCVILGGGPSLSQLDLSLLSGYKVIGVNDTYKLGQWDICYFKDANWYFQEAFKGHPPHNGELLLDFHGWKITSCNTQSVMHEPGIKTIHRGRRDHLDLDRNFLTHCNNAGAEALALAIMLGSKTIALVGFDMKPLKGKHNWHLNHVKKMPESIYADYYMRPFKMLAKGAEKKGVSIYNCTLGSALTIFPIVPVERILNADRRMRA